MEIKRLGEADTEVVQDILVHLLHSTDEGTSLPSIHHLKNFFYDERCYVLAAILENKAVGVALAYRFPSFYATEHMAYLYDVEVLPNYRKMGIGRSLIHELILQLKADNVREIWLGTSVDNRAAQHLFESTGGQKEKETFYEYMYTIPPKIN